LDSIFDFDAVFQDVTAAGLKAITAFVDSWTSDFRTQIKLVNGWCPKLFFQKESLLDHPMLCKALLDNTEGYAKLGPMCNAMKEELKLAKGLHPLFAEDVLGEVKDAMQLGLQTVGFTFVVFYLVLAIPKATNTTKIQSECSLVRSYVVDKLKVALTDQMEQMLTNLENGEMTIDALKLHFAAVNIKAPASPAASAPTVPPAAPPPTVPPSEVAVEPIVPPAVVAAPTVPPAGVDALAQSPDAAAVLASAAKAADLASLQAYKSSTKRARLSERVQAAKANGAL
jgi:hypothetical protein